MNLVRNWHKKRLCHAAISRTNVKRTLKSLRGFRSIGGLVQELSPLISREQMQRVYSQGCICIIVAHYHCQKPVGKRLRWCGHRSSIHKVLGCIIGMQLAKSNTTLCTRLTQSLACAILEPRRRTTKHRSLYFKITGPLSKKAPCVREISATANVAPVLDLQVVEGEVALSSLSILVWMNMLQSASLIHSFIHLFTFTQS
mmetsp:Transcript_10510/g.20715  ORF Transcript_10510/g.20715 Transcript_10510/m.20715 type:complete len:200 (-) Transcript_10510:128-727(-)